MIVQKQVLHLTADIGYHLFCFLCSITNHSGLCTRQGTW